MGIPNHLFNATATFYSETNPKGSFGQPSKVLTSIGTAKVRCDMTNEARMVQDGNYEQRRRVFRLFTNRLPPTLNTKTWVRVKTNANGMTFLGQIDSINYPGMSGHHSELTVIENPPMEFTIG